MTDTHSVPTIATPLGRYPITSPPDDLLGNPYVIASHLACLQRYGGSLAVPYTVLQHSVGVYRLLREAGADRETLVAGLLHDVPEIVTGAITRPVQEFFGIADDLGLLHDRLLARALSICGVSDELIDWRLVYQCDDMMLAIELHYLFGEELTVRPVAPNVDYRLASPGTIANSVEVYRHLLHSTLSLPPRCHSASVDEMLHTSTIDVGVHS